MNECLVKENRADIIIIWKRIEVEVGGNQISLEKSPNLSCIVGSIVVELNYHKSTYIVGLCFPSPPNNFTSFEKRKRWNSLQTP